MGEVNKMKKGSIGIITAMMAILLFVSMSTSVSADDGTLPFHEVNMNTYIYSNEPFVDARIVAANPPVYAYCQLTAYASPHYSWDMDITNGEDVEIKSTCTWEDYYSPPGENPTGYHEYTLEATYVYGIIEIDHDVDFNLETYGASDPPETDSQDIGVIFYDCMQGGTITVTWTAYARNLFASSPGAPVEATAIAYGTINLV
jgi:hypothetical protein